MKIVVTGANGQVGRALVLAAESDGHEAVAFSHGDLDIADMEAVHAALSDLKPTHVINSAAYNAVDRAEDDFDAAFRTNALGPAHLALAARRSGAVIIHYSSDYVFDGEKEGPYNEEDRPNPISTYGRSKLLGERAVAGICDRHYIIRTSWVFAPGGNNFISRLLPRIYSGESLRFVDDQRVAPTYASDIARATLELMRRDVPFGIYHASGKEAYTPYEWACAVAEHAGAGASIAPVSSGEFETRAARPAQSILANTKLDELGIAMRPGIRCLDDFFER
jgi:dTDP-4-dehydrorhamnose reductase